MNTLASRSVKFGTLCALLLGAAPGAFATDVVLQKVPPLTVEQAPAFPTNLARYSLGASVEASAPGDNTSATASLLSGDPASSYSLTGGKTTLLVSLAKVENVDSVAFQNIGAKGSVMIATSNAKLPADSPQWHAATQQDLGAESVKATIGPSEAKYVRLTFDVTEPGKIAGFGVYATSAVSDFTAPRHGSSASFGLVSYSRADIHAKARALYVSSGADVMQANKMIDDQTTTAYSFDANDGSPTTVIDLGKSATVRRLSAVYSPKPGNIQFYLLQSLPGAAVASAMPQTLKFDDKALSAMKPVGSAKDDGSLGRASVDFPETTGRYVLVRWTPATQQDSSFTMAEIAAIGAGNGKLLAANTGAPSSGASDELQTSDGKTMLDGKTMIEPKDMPAEGPQSPGEGPPPTLPQPPPFTFVPVLVPNSP